MTELDGTLSELAKLRSGSEPIVSLYLDVRWSDEQQREKVRVFVQERVRQTLGHYPPGTPGREGLLRTLARVQEHVNQLAGQTVSAEEGGLALFACESLGLWRTFSFRYAFESELCTDGIPHLTQLARLADDSEPAILVAPSPQGADVYLVALGGLAAERHLRGFVPRGGEQEENAPTGGPGRRHERDEKDERHVEAFVQKNRKVAIEEVARLAALHPRAHLVLVGVSATLGAFERELPERIREQVIARLPKPREWSGNGNGALRDGILEEVAKLVAEREKESEREAVDAVVGEALRGGLGIIGPDDVVQALNQGRVHRLVLEADFRRAGWRCDNCDALGANAESAESCPYCGGELHVLQHLGEALVARTLAEGGVVEVVAHANKLHSYAGVGAFLRQTSASGLRGANQAWPTAPGASQPT